MPIFSQRCPCLQAEEEEVRVLDYRHCSLDYMPSEVFHYERTLEELYLDANQIKEMPRELFYCHGIRKLSLADNDIIRIPSAIASLINLESLDISKNGVVDFPDNIKGCKYLRVIEASVNPLGKLPEGFTQLLNLSELYLNDTFLDYLPGSFGRLTNLKVLEVRENHLNTLPKSMSRLTALERLDIGNNDFTELPDVIGSLPSLLELWCDCNDIDHIPKELGYLKHLMFLDASKNRIEWLAKEIDGCVNLADLYLSTNLLQQLPESIGRLTNLTTLRVDDNRLTTLPFSIGGLVSLSDLNISANDLEEIPAGIGYLRHLRTFYADENFLYEIPPEVGSCTGITVLSLRSNNITYVPEELGRIPKLRVLNLSDNKIRSLPYSLTRLKELQALWLSENQTKPLIRLQPEIDPETGQRTLTCYLLPQMPNDDRDDMYSDAGSFHPSLWEEERKQRQRIHFDFDAAAVEEDCKLERTPTPYPKEMKHRLTHMRNLALKQLNIQNGDARKPKNSESSAVQHDAMSDDAKIKAASTLKVHNAPTNVPSTSKPTSPVLQERHLLLKADKEKKQKDKAKIAARRSSQEDIRSDQLPSYPSGALRSPQVEDGGFSSSSRRHPLSDVGSPFDSSHVQPRIKSDLDLNANMSQDGSKPGSYNDFLRGLSSGNMSAPPGRPVVPDYRSPQSMATFYARTSYESDTDYRSDTGYRSDQEALRHRKYHMARVRPDGYSSDMDMRSRAGRHAPRREAGYSSDMEMYAKSRSGSKYRPVSAMPSYSSIPEHRDPGRGSSGNGQQSRGHLPPPPPPNYSNAPFTKRTTLRNDELYEQYPGASQMSPHPHILSKSQSVKRSPSLSSAGGTSRLRSGSNDQISTRSGSVRSGLNISSHDNQQIAANSDEEIYKAQLYQASVKLQKTPSDRRKNPSQKAMVVDMSHNSSMHSDYMSQSMSSDAHGVPHSPAPPRYAQGVVQKSHPSPRPSSLPLKNTATPRQMDSSYHPTSPPHPTQQTPLLMATPKSANTSHLPSPQSKTPLISGSAHLGPTDIDSPLRLSQYEKDVAVYKQMEPASHVSSSTDSGYGHGHMFDRLPGMEGRLSDEATPSIASTPHTGERMSRDSLDGSSCQVTPASSSLSHSPASGVSPKSGVFQATLIKNPGLGFSIAGGLGSPGNPFRADDEGIFITKVQPDGPAAKLLLPGDKILEVNGVDFRRCEHSSAVGTLRTCSQTAILLIER